MGYVPRLHARVGSLHHHLYLTGRRYARRSSQKDAGAWTGKDEVCRAAKGGGTQNPPYYRNAVSIGNRLAENKSKVHLVGHSLGGGLASAAQGGSGLTASTYNAAGLHPLTVARYSADLNHMKAEVEKITSIRVKGDVLTKTQEDLWGSNGLSLLANPAVGKKQVVLPSHDVLFFENPKSAGKVGATDSYGTYLHGMDEVIDSTEINKKTTETILKACLQRTRR